ncbi:glycerate kinase [Solicola gregarius]|uniref:Glycerate kinase n=1 Tax=Solicola gregarius TaxID=2908642 RepID=A0AA46TKZ7_9ACTN|nr:glycerate kinase [Solicola gregarius]UYM06353.1 glycerate kinase [Solicola gregarius]
MTEVLLCPDKFKGSLTAAEVSDSLRAGIADVRPGVRVESFEVSDGGDGLLDAVVPHGFAIRTLTAQGPTGQPRMARIATRGSTSIIELAEVVGLRRLSDDRPAPLTASTYGLGQAMLAAIDAGSTELVVGLGGSASTDGGAGMVEALGARLGWRGRRPPARGGGGLAGVASVELSELDRRLRHTSITLAADVDHPLLGERGSARTFAAQKGATPQEIYLLEAAMAKWAAVVTTATGMDVADRPGAGAAGGTGFAAMAILGATMRSGIDFLLRLGDFTQQIGSADLVIVGEGSLDQQSLRGKAPIGVANAATAAGVEVIAICGVNRLDEMQSREAGLAGVYSLDASNPTLNAASNGPGR